MAVEISGVTLCPGDDLITAAWLDYPRMGPVDGYAFEVFGWVVSKAPVAEVEFVCEGSVVARCELTVSRPDVAKSVWAVRHEWDSGRRSERSALHRPSPLG